MKIPSFALLCCCCCTQAALTGSPFDNGHGVENHQRIFYGEQNLESGHESKKPRVAQFKAADFYAGVGNVAYDFIFDGSRHDDHDHDQDHDHDHDHDPDDDVNEKWTKAEQWGYAILANSCVVCLSLCGILIVKCTNGNNRRIIGDYFLGLVVSIMLGDSLLHIMPEALGLHDHDHDDHDHDDHDDSEYYLVIGKMATSLATVYLFWFLQSLMSITGCGHSHDHDHDHGVELGKVAPEPQPDTEVKEPKATQDLKKDHAPVADNGKFERFSKRTIFYMILKI